ncbi:hypothetical protein KIL84_000962 [Mauremys mutica]|uniref:Uncharacterized protein n=1 Tax=Mauremys mutica TaxID=74926 RepID=A0A9D4ANW2_9SAUR|nr:hypothetical protein KIL84_000962 [Mauremys mutica]
MPWSQASQHGPVTLYPQRMEPKKASRSLGPESPSAHAKMHTVFQLSVMSATHVYKHWPRKETTPFLMQDTSRARKETGYYPYELPMMHRECSLDGRVHGAVTE